MRVLALPDGTLADPDQPFVRADDLGLLRGDGVFETVLVVDGKPREWAGHLDRLVRSAAMLDLEPPDLAGVERAGRAVIDHWTGGELALRLVCTRGAEGGDGTPTVFALGSEVGAKARRQRVDGVSAIALDRGFDADLAERAPWLLLGAKSLSYAVNMAALREAERRGADDVVFTTPSGEVLEGPTSTLVLVRGRTLRTPPSALGILPGTTQAALFEVAAGAGWTTEVGRVDVADLYDADAVLLASSVRLIARVHTLDGKSLPDSSEVHAELAACYESRY
ncbi:aminodeoxychorismate lyase [Saccharothrix violaceirubra]|uniref:4-amino-4-deoxychorismate lyase n=1 Tax=Saccharothrix violaceirubra TaxID=413306 RepID=A0A7W7SX96_9PSEU|nr:aminodeoxychorismate lyase [Saccharothrix violaceirubra]MBB4962649.1 4-amino-4-deoxychorismate lyase [Saccharothrix violaceirubra]